MHVIFLRKPVDPEIVPEGYIKVSPRTRGQLLSYKEALFKQMVANRKIPGRYFSPTELEELSNEAEKHLKSNDFEIYVANENNYDEEEYFAPENYGAQLHAKENKKRANAHAATAKKRANPRAATAKKRANAHAATAAVGELSHARAANAAVDELSGIFNKGLRFDNSNKVTRGIAVGIPNNVKSANDRHEYYLDVKSAIDRHEYYLEEANALLEFAINMLKIPGLNKKSRKLALDQYRLANRQKSLASAALMRYHKNMENILSRNQMYIGGRKTRRHIGGRKTRRHSRRHY